jgi:hypothetical protein
MAPYKAGPEVWGEIRREGREEGRMMKRKKEKVMIGK